MKALALRAVVVMTADLPRLVRFHTALGFVPVGEAGPPTAPWAAALGLEGRRVTRQVMRCGAQEVAFVCADPPGAPVPPDGTATDMWFQHMALVVGDMAEAHRRAVAAGAVPISRGGPVQLPPAAGGVRAFKFRDPDGHPLELLWFPAGQGDPRWQGPGPLFRGIDHSAIAVRNADDATTALRRQLGLVPGAATLNHGPTQSRLDDVDGAVVDVVPLSPAEATPHVELLGYRTGTRRPWPVAAGPADVVATRLVFTVTPAPEAGPQGLAGPDGHRMVAVGSDGADMI